MCSRMPPVMVMFALMHCCIRFLTIFAEHLHVSIILCTFAVDLVKRYQSIHILLTALAIISRIPKTLQDLTEIARNNDKGIPVNVLFLSYITMLTLSVSS